MKLRLLAALLLTAAGAIHLAVTPEHFEEWFLFGAFMLGCGLAQIAAAALLLTRPSRPLLWLTLAGTVGVLALFAIVYSVGLPFGPDPGKPEQLGIVVTVSKLVEFATVPLLLALLGQPARRRLRLASAVTSS